MSKASAAAEPSMEEILASIRRIISDGDEAAGQAAAPAVSAVAEPADEVDEAAEEDDGEVSADDFEAVPAASFDEVAYAEEADEGEADDDDASADVLDLTEDMMEDAGEAADEPPVAAAAPEPAPAPAPETSRDFVEPRQTDVVFGDHPSTPGEARMSSTETRATTDTAPPPPPGNGHDAAGHQLLSPGSDATVAAAFGKLANTILTHDARTLDDIVKEMLRPMLKEWLDDNLPPLVERLVRDEIERVSRGRP